jgi:ABC-type methionine transport system permease subunit
MLKALASLLLVLPLASCLVGAAIGATGAVVGAAVGATGAVVGATVDAVTPGDDDDDEDDD